MVAEGVKPWYMGAWIITLKYTRTKGVTLGRGFNPGVYEEDIGCNSELQNILFCPWV